MPYKFNEGRRHKIPKAKYKVTNWPVYDAALVRRGSLTVWVTEEAIAAWHASATGKPGGQPVYSDLAIETGLALRLVLRLGLRQIEGTLRSSADTGSSQTIKSGSAASARAMPMRWRSA
jgi:Transposase DDE domain